NVFTKEMPLGIVGDRILFDESRQCATPTSIQCHCNSRGDWIRTSDLTVPNSIQGTRRKAQKPFDSWEFYTATTSLQAISNTCKQWHKNEEIPQSRNGCAEDFRASNWPSRRRHCWHRGNRQMVQSPTLLATGQITVSLVSPAGHCDRGGAGD